MEIVDVRRVASKILDRASVTTMLDESAELVPWIFTSDLEDLKYLYFDTDKRNILARFGHGIKALFDFRYAANMRELYRAAGIETSFLTTVRGNWSSAKETMKNQGKSIPDGQIKGELSDPGSGICATWGEDGDYIECVGPTVGIKLAAFLDQDPTNPHAVAIAKEIDQVLRLSKAQNLKLSQS